VGIEDSSLRNFMAEQETGAQKQKSSEDGPKGKCQIPQGLWITIVFLILLSAVATLCGFLCHSKVEELSTQLKDSKKNAEEVGQLAEITKGLEGITEKQSQKQVSDEEVKKLYDEVWGLKEKVASLTGEIKALRDENLQATIAGLRQKSEDLQNQLAELKAQKTAAQSTINVAPPNVTVQPPNVTVSPKIEVPKQEASKKAIIMIGR
jgi:archaellum component FlaC